LELSVFFVLMECTSANPIFLHSFFMVGLLACQKLRLTSVDLCK
jgi:hypothetical protein